MKPLLTLALSLFCTMSNAADLTYLPTVHHFQRENLYGNKWNENTRGIKLTLDNGLTVGTMKNSYFKQSSYIGYTYRPIKVGNVEAGVMAGLVSGYDSKAMALKAPVMGAATIKWQATEKYHVEVIAVPTVGKSSGFVSVGFGTTF